jgi:[glutamine synthetase] adenylyltransferase / [glutamine synthetase]-adenylyl-L-tyrosine phosphorylase
MHRLRILDELRRQLRRTVDRRRPGIGAHRPVAGVAPEPAGSSVTVNLAQSLPAAAGSPGPSTQGLQQDLSVSAPAGTARADHSRFVARVRRRDAARLDHLAPGEPTAASLRDAVARLQREGQPLEAALRIVRRLALERLAVLDVEGAASLDVVTRSMTTLAEVMLDLAIVQAQHELDARHGPPRNAQGRRIELWIVGMGKLGARELNVSSDIDLVYVYEEEGLTDGRPADDGAAVPAGRITAHEYFAALARRLYALIGDVTDEGFVFRVDLALRPNGASGPPVVSLAMLEEYFQSQGREWERFAWLKSRVVAPREAVASGRALALRPLVTSFVYRRYLDYGVFEGLRQLHRKVRQEAQRRAAGRPERANDVKLSRGGIREIEFIVQLMLVVRGGQFPEMRTRSTLKALDHLAAAGLMKPASATRLADIYRFLRRVEHRIQYLDDQQTHLLPTDDADLRWIASSLGLPGGPQDDPVATLMDTLGAAREFVAGEFDALLHDGRAPDADAGGCRACGVDPPMVDSDAFLSQLPEAIRERVEPWVGQPRLRVLRDESKQRLARLIGRAARAAQEGRCSLDAAVRFVDWLEPLLRRESYLALLLERPPVHERLLRLLGLARWPMRYLLRHPGVIDELADERQVHARFDPAAYTAQLQDRHAAWERSGQASEEFLLDTLRRAHHAEVFRILARDVEGLIDVEQVADDLSALADATLQCAIEWAWPLLRQRHRQQPALAIVAYGKLGGKELGYGSDLDVVFAYDDEGDEPDRASEVYGAFVRKLITWLTLRTAAGELFDIDTALRPNGSSGMLVTSLRAFGHYQVGRGSNTAWTWEHQAITRARFCAGDPTLAPRVEAIRRQVLCAARDPAALRGEVLAMRERVRAASSVKAGRFDLKHSPGGMMDAEFAVQYLVLAHAGRQPALLANRGNIALLHAAQEAGLLPPGVGAAAADAYRELRRAQHRARLDEQPTALPGDAMRPEREAIGRLWQAVFG